MALRQSEIEGLDTLLEEQKAKFDGIQNEIKQLESRSSELENNIASRSNESLEDVQANDSDRKELEQIRVVLRNLKEKHRKMIEEGSKELAKELGVIKANHIAKLKADFRSVEGEQVKDLWNQIRAINKSVGEQEHQDRLHLSSRLQEFEKYLDGKRNLTFGILTRSVDFISDIGQGSI